MSTGSELLRRLQQQRNVQQVQQQRQQRNSSAAGTTTAAEERNLQQRQRATAITALTTIEVCLGPDCSGSGGGAALLEIEELVSRRTKSNSSVERHATLDKKNSVTVVPGGCRDFCTVGPNVHVRKIVGENDAHHSKVNGPEACREIVASFYEEEENAAVATTTTSETSASTGDASVADFLRRREDGIRWRSHRKRAALERRLRVRER